MEFTFNGVIPNEIYFNNNSLNRVTCNGVTVWEKQQPVIYNYLKFTSTGNSTISMGNSNNTPDIKYSLDDGITWTQWDYSAISLSNGDIVCFKGNNPNGFSQTATKYSYFIMTGSLAAFGSVMSLLDDIGETNIIPNKNCFSRLFMSCTSLTSVPELTATTLTQGCYRYMFMRCTGLTSIPANLLPATNLAPGCYSNMFADCSNLTSIPANLLPATNLAQECYWHMFGSCSNLTSIPANLLPATNLAPGCYGAMFASCSSLTSIPVNLLPATTLAANCYDNMFASCSSLTSIPVNLLPATTLADYCYYQMFYNCTELTNATDLLATTLVSSCYRSMFFRCAKITYMKCLATNVSSQDLVNTQATSGWLDPYDQTPPSSGTFVRNASSASWPRGTSGIPTGWTVQTA